MAIRTRCSPMTARPRCSTPRLTTTVPIRPAIPAIASHVASSPAPRASANRSQIARSRDRGKMMNRRAHSKLAAAGLLLVASVLLAHAQPTRIAHTQIKDLNGQYVGYADLIEMSGGLLIRISLKDVEPGQHAVHIHSVGKCEPPFQSAGPHFNPANKPHGFMTGEGHAGDLPNLHVPDSGALEIEMLTTKVTLEPGKPNSLVDADGSSLVIHAGSDDFRTDPEGDSGARIACGVITSESTVGQSPR